MEGIRKDTSVLEAEGFRPFHAPNNLLIIFRYHDYGKYGRDVNDYEE